MTNILFVGGLPRTGSTLFMNLLAQNPRFMCSPTSPLVELFMSLSGSYASSNQAKAWLPQEEILSNFNSGRLGLLQYWASNALLAKSTATWYVDKSRWWSGQYNSLKEIIDQPKMIIMIRDLRGILGSMERIWLSRPDLTSSTELLLPSVVERVNAWLEPTAEPVGASLSRLRDLFNKDYTKNMLFVRFEDLVNKPQETMNQVYAYLEEFTYTHDINNVKQTTRENDVFHAPYGIHTVKSTVTPTTPQGWEDVLPQGVSDSLVSTYDWFYNQFYPDLSI